MKLSAFFLLIYYTKIINTIVLDKEYVLSDIIENTEIIKKNINLYNLPIPKKYSSIICFNICQEYSYLSGDSPILYFSSTTTWRDFNTYDYKLCSLTYNIKENCYEYNDEIRLYIYSYIYIYIILIYKLLPILKIWETKKYEILFLGFIYIILSVFSIIFYEKRLIFKFANFFMLFIFICSYFIKHTNNVGVDTFPNIIQQMDKFFTKEVGDMKSLDPNTNSIGKLYIHIANQKPLEPWKCLREMKIQQEYEHIPIIKKFQAIFDTGPLSEEDIKEIEEDLKEKCKKKNICFYKKNLKQKENYKNYILMLSMWMEAKEYIKNNYYIKEKYKIKRLLKMLFFESRHAIFIIFLSNLLNIILKTINFGLAPIFDYELWISSPLDFLVKIILKGLKYLFSDGMMKLKPASVNIHIGDVFHGLFLIIIFIIYPIIIKR